MPGPDLLWILACILFAFAAGAGPDDDGRR